MLGTDGYTKESFYQSVGKDIFWDYIVNDPNRFKNSNVEEIKSKWEKNN